LEFSTSLDVIGPILQICLIDLLLSGDNAILIAMACVDLPADIRRKAVVLGTGVAVLFRVLLAFAATLALRAPYIKLLGAVLLLLIAIELVASDSTGHKQAAARDAKTGVWRAILLIVVADAVMSLDNVVAVAAAAQDSLLYLMLGLLISVPILVFSSLLIMRVLHTHPVVIEAGGALLGWVAGKTAVSDPAIAAGLQTQSFGLVALAPLLGAAYVLIQGRILRAQRGQSVGAAMPAPAMMSVPEIPVATKVPAAKIEPAVDTPQAVAPEAESADAAGLPKKFSKMDLTIMAGVAVPLLGLLVMVVYMIGKAVFSK